MFPKIINKKDIGSRAEINACNFLQRNGLKLLTKNYYCRHGEIDLIMNDNEVIVFIEVRYRKNHLYGDAKESITVHKQKKIRTTALHYMQSKSEQHEARFDVIAITGEGSLQNFEWIKNAF
ncbi:MAG: YraN family protein [Gammaproteobacteria bacterium]|nr:YraN family protein [Gammaproteobacteria bacterium]MDH5735916.1 YraN family protein [Gammaproteobacteria bacterium]